jgi:hypothetical protein
LVVEIGIARLGGGQIRLRPAQLFVLHLQLDLVDAQRLLGLLALGAIGDKAVPERGTVGLPLGGARCR